MASCLGDPGTANRARLQRILWCAGLVLGLSATGGASDPALESRFADPPKSTRILKIIHGWPDAQDARVALLERLERQGFGGVVCNVSFDGYLESPSKWQIFEEAVSAAKARGWTLWLYDERGYPSGNAGGLVLRDHPEWEARGLLVADAETDGDAVELASPPGTLVLAEAYTRVHGVRTGAPVDLAGQIEGGVLRWNPPAGPWSVRIVTEDRLYEGTHAAGNLWEKMPYVNLLQRPPTARFLQVTHDAYAQHFGADLGRTFVATFTDEPSLMSLFLKPMPYRVLPWSDELPAEFARRRGYALRAILPDLIADPGLDGPRHRYDFWLTISELVSENFFGQIQDWCHHHGILSGGHLLAEEMLVGHVPLYGDFLRCARRLDAPSIDCLTSVPAEVPWWVARLIASAAELEGKSLVMCETSDHSQHYRPPGDSRPVRPVTEDEMRGTLNRLMVGGVNQITSYYSFDGLSDENLQRLNNWTGRCATLLTGGRQVADVAVLYPIETLWTRFEPSHVWTRDAVAAQTVESLYRAATESLFAARRDYTVIDSRTLAQAKADQGALRHRDLAWRVIVLPGVDTLPMAAWENLAQFVRSGGVVIALGARPTNSEAEFPCSQVATLSDELFGAMKPEPTTKTNPAGGAGIHLPSGSEALLPIVLDSILQRDVGIDIPRAPVRATHRRIDDHDVYFLINDSGAEWSGLVRLAATGPGEQFDPETGAIEPITVDGPISLTLPTYGATLLRFPAQGPTTRHTIGPGSLSLPNLSVEPLRVGSPRLLKGESVRAEMQPLEQGLRWRSRSELTKGGVDTFFFAEFPCDSSAVLSDACCVVVNASVPDGQRAATELLVILHEEGGGDFIASTGRRLDAPGERQSLIPLERFQLPPWSKDADGTLDLARVSAIRIGWGGYLGSEGETVELDVAPPQIGLFPVPPSTP